MIKGIFNLIKRTYMQFLFILFFTIILSYILNPILSLDDFKTRLLFGSIFLIFFSFLILATQKI